MEPNFQKNYKEASPTSPPQESSLDRYEYVPKFKHIQEDLLYMFQIKVPDEESLHDPKVISQLYTSAMKELSEGTPFGLDYMIDEGLLTKEYITERGITDDMKASAFKILDSYKGTRLARAKKVFIDAGILNDPKHLH